MSENTKKSTGYFVDPPTFKSCEFNCMSIVDYRSLYPEPFELVLQDYNLDVITLFKYKHNYGLIQKIFNEKIDDYEFQLNKAEFIKIVKEIIDLEK